MSGESGAGEPSRPVQMSQQGGFIAAFIKRPVLASVFSLLIVIAGLAAMLGVEVRELPDVDQPVVTIDTRYPGATPESIDAEVTSVIESAVAQVDGVASISSSSSRDRSRELGPVAEAVPRRPGEGAPVVRIEAK